MKNINIYISYLIRAIRSKFCLLLIISFVWLYRVDFMPDSGLGLAKIIQICALLYMGLWTYHQKGSWFNWTLNHSNSSIRWLLLLYLFAVVSTLWAFNRQFAAFLSLQNVVFIILLFTLCAKFKNFYSLERFFVYGLLTAFLFEAIVSRIEEPFLFNHFLPAGSTAAISLSYCFSEYLNSTFQTPNECKRKQLLSFGIVTSFIVVVLSTSTGANVSAVAGIAIGLMFSRHRIWGALMMVTAVLLYLNIDKMDQLVLLIAPGKTIEEVQTGTGREQIWDVLLSYANQKPWLGWGFACIERVHQLDVLEGQSLSDAHNFYIGIYGGLGIVGCVLLGIHILYQLTFTFKRVNRIGFLGLLSASCCALVNGYSYGYLSGKACSITLAYFSVVVLTYYYARVRSHD